MDDEKRPKTADWEPGTLERTRRAIGDISPDEAKVMSQKLGGEVMYERDPQDEKPSVRNNMGRIVRRERTADAGRQEEAAETSEADAPVNPRSLREELPPVSAKMNSMLNKLMMSPEYGIKRNLGIFNFIKYFQKDGQEQVAADFCTTTMNSHIEKMQEFITAVKTLIQLAPEPYKARIANEMDSKFKFLRTVAGWTTHQLKLIHLNMQELPQPHIVQDLIPYTRTVYRLVLQLYYFGDAKIPKLIKEVYEDEADCPGAPQEKLYESAKEAITNWLYIQTEIIQKLYPLLMRMCSDTFEEYPDFFKTKTGSILKFVGLHKYDLLLPEKPKEAETKPAEEPKPKAAITRGARDGIVETGIRLLDQLFPQAGFARLESHPDFYPYFQPLYKFADGFNVLHPENPLQTTIVLLRIVEDCLQGCRNIQFNEAEQNSTGNGRPDSMEKAIDEWSGYRETVFERLYCEPLNHLVNEVYSQTDFENSRMGKKFLNSLLWQTRYHFLPNFKFEQVLLERPADDSKMQPLFFRTDFVRKFLMGTAAQCDAAKNTRGLVAKIQNPWERYRFDVPNEISKRLDVILGGQKKSQPANATNANLLKYTLCIISVLDWWINNPESPAYAMSPKNIYRVSAEDGKPQFSVPLRNDQNKLFVERIRAACQKPPAR